MSECTKNVSRVYPEGHKSPSGHNPAYRIRKQTLQALYEFIPRNLKELRYGG